MHYAGRLPALSHGSPRWCWVAEAHYALFVVRLLAVVSLPALPLALLAPLVLLAVLNELPSDPRTKTDYAEAQVSLHAVKRRLGASQGKMPTRCRDGAERPRAWWPS